MHLNHNAFRATDPRDINGSTYDPYDGPTTAADHREPEEFEQAERVRDAMKDMIDCHPGRYDDQGLGDVANAFGVFILAIAGIFLAGLGIGAWLL